MENRNARFWTFINGDPVKITLRPGQLLSHWSGAKHDEGFRNRWESWEHAGSEVITTTDERGSDCDGRYSRGSCHSCPIARLAECSADEPDYQQFHAGELIRFPFWQMDEMNQREYAAEAAGY